MNLKQALYVRTIAEVGTISGAARRLYITQPSLSQMLKQIETEIGLPLFDRSVFPFKLTFAGERYLKAAEAMLAVEDKLNAELDSIKHENSGSIRLGMSVTRAVQVLPTVLSIFSKQYPNVTIELTECGSAVLEEMLQKGKIDLAMAAMETNGTSLTYELIEKETFGILAGRDSNIARRHYSGTPLILREARDDSFVYLNQNHSSRILQDKLFRKHGFTPTRVLLETDSLELARRVALEAGACMMIPNIYADEYVSKLHGAFFPLSDYENHRHFYVCYRKDEYMPKYARDFINITTSVLAKFRENDISYQ